MHSIDHSSISVDEQHTFLTCLQFVYCVSYGLRSVNLTGFYFYPNNSRRETRTETEMKNVNLEKVRRRSPQKMSFFNTYTHIVKPNESCTSYNDTRASSKTQKKREKKNTTEMKHDG